VCACVCVCVRVCVCVCVCVHTFLFGIPAGTTVLENSGFRSCLCCVCVCVGVCVYVCVLCGHYYSITLLGYYFRDSFAITERYNFEKREI
jgi:hypothetical protein